MIELFAQFIAGYTPEILLGLGGMLLTFMLRSNLQRVEELSRRISALESDNGKLRDRLEDQAVRIGALTSERNYLERTVESLRERVNELEAHERKPPEVA